MLFQQLERVLRSTRYEENSVPDGQLDQQHTDFEFGYQQREKR